MADLNRFIAEYKAGMNVRAVADAPPDPRRMVALTAAFTPMIAVAAVPITAVAILVAGAIGNLTALWVGIALLVVGLVVAGHVAARMAAASDSLVATRGWRRWLPLAATAAVVAEGVGEIASGGRAPGDPILLLWIVAPVWLLAFFPLARGTWGRTRRALWVIGPAVMFLAVVFVWTQGLFWLRFKLAVSDFDKLEHQESSGSLLLNGPHAGGFVVHDVERGAIRGDQRCDLGFWITGWHDEDTRYIVHCTGHPQGGFSHLEGEWWQLKDKQPPSNL